MESKCLFRSLSTAYLRKIHVRNGHFDERKQRLTRNEIVVLNQQFHCFRTERFKKYTGCNEALGSKKGRGFLDQMNDYKFIKDFDLWS
jgi:hypothetical protein